MFRDIARFELLGPIFVLASFVDGLARFAVVEQKKGRKRECPGILETITIDQTHLDSVLHDMVWYIETHHRPSYFLDRVSAMRYLHDYFGTPVVAGV